MHDAASWFSHACSAPSSRQTRPSRRRRRTSTSAHGPVPWEGSGSGGFELTLEKGADGALRGSVSVTGEPTYKATLKTVALEGAVLTATYDFTPDDRAEVALEATFDGNAASGTWVLREKASGSEAARGTWSVKRT